MKSKIFFLFLIVTLILSAANLNAEPKAGSFYASPNFGYIDFAKTADYEGASTYGVSLGYHFSEFIGIEATYDNVDTEIVPGGIVQGSAMPPGPPPPGWTPSPPVTIAPGGAKVSGYQARIEGIYYIYLFGQKFAPYVALGIGILRYEYEGIERRETNVPGGFGCKYFITDNIAFRADIRSVMPVHRNNILGTVGLSFQFGGK